VPRKGHKSTETVYLISSLTVEQLDALGWIKLKRGYWAIESRLHHALAGGRIRRIPVDVRRDLATE
jgi:hypothetical protein